VFETWSDPVERGFVTSLNRPGGNLTGISNFTDLLVGKVFDLLQELVPNATVIGVLVNPTTPILADSVAQGVQAAGRVRGKQIHILNASTNDLIDAAFATLAKLRPDAMLVSGDPFFLSRRDQLVALAAAHRLPTMYNAREYPIAGGLVSYGASLTDAYRQTGIYIGKILKGANPADLPVMQPSKFELVINLKTAKALGLSVPLIMQMTADEVIE
jgi:putative ABC transport system substrate-binding protein